jgi:NitT/TauT family transport system permease protein
MSSGGAGQWLKLNALRLAVVVIFFAIWEYVSYRGIVAELFISRPSVFFVRLASMIVDPSTYYDMYVTLAQAIIGWTLGAVAGLILGYALGVNKLLDEVFRPLAEVANAIPKIVLAPLFIMWFGLGMASKVAFGFSLVVFIVFFNVYAGVKSVDPDLVKKARVLGASTWQINRYVLIPSIMSWFISSLRISFAFALAASIVGEFVASARGIGSAINKAAAIFDTAYVFAALVLISAAVFGISMLLARAESWLLRWRPGNASGRPVM